MNSPQTLLRLSAAQVPDWLAAHPEALVLDARDASDHAQGRLPGSQRLDGRNHEPLLLRASKNQPVFIYCYRGHASRTYARMFLDFGFHDVADLVGGWQAMAGARNLGPHLGSGRCPRQCAADAGGLAWRRRGRRSPAVRGRGPGSGSNRDGNNALWLACVANDSSLVSRLVVAGVPIDHQNLTGATSLMYAALQRQIDVLRYALGARGRRAADHTGRLQPRSTWPPAFECLQLLRPTARRRSGGDARMTHLIFYEKPGCAGNARQRAILENPVTRSTVAICAPSRGRASDCSRSWRRCPSQRGSTRRRRGVKTGEIVPEDLGQSKR